MSDTRSPYVAAGLAAVALLLLWTNGLLVVQNRALSRQAEVLERTLALQERPGLSRQMAQLHLLSQRTSAVVRTGGQLLENPRPDAVKALIGALEGLEGTGGVQQTLLVALASCRVPAHLARARDHLSGGGELSEHPVGARLHALGELLPGVDDDVLRKVLADADLSPRIASMADEVGSLASELRHRRTGVLADSAFTQRLRRVLMHSVGVAASCRVEAERLFEASQR